MKLQKLTNYPPNLCVLDIHDHRRAEEQALTHPQLKDLLEQRTMIFHLLSLFFLATFLLACTQVKARNMFVQHMIPSRTRAAKNHVDTAEIKQRSIQRLFLGRNDDPCPLMALFADSL